MKIWSIILLSFVLLSCQEKEKKASAPSKDEKKAKVKTALLGKWNIILITPENQKIEKKVDSIYREQMLLLLEDSYFLLQEDGRFSEQILSNHRKGKWLLDDNLKQININFPTISESWKIISMGKDTLRLEAQTLEKTKVTFTAVKD